MLALAGAANPPSAPDRDPPTAGPAKEAEPPATQTATRAEGAPTVASEEASAPRPVPEDRRISIDVRGARLRNVLGQLADFGHINLVVPGDITGKVTLTLRSVPWFQALEAVARSHGLGLQRRGNILFIDKLQRLAAYDETQVRIQEAQTAAAPLVTRIFRLSYARAEDLVPLVKTLLSPRGSVVVDRRTNVLIVTDVAPRVRSIAAQVKR